MIIQDNILAKIEPGDIINGTVEIPTTVTEIGIRAFSGLSDLIKINIPESVTEIGHYCFENCKNLKIVFIPDSVKKLGTECFCECESLKDIRLSKNIIEILYRTFAGCKNLEEIYIPDDIAFSSEVFKDCISLKKVRLPNGIRDLTGTFLGCISLQEIEIPEGVEEIYETFYGCKSLKKVVLPESISCINSKTFCGCEELTQIIISGHVENICENAFLDCKKLTEIIGLENVAQIDITCFEGCDSLNEIKIKEISISDFSEIKSIQWLYLDAANVLCVLRKNNEMQRYYFEIKDKNGCVFENISEELNEEEKQKIIEQIERIFRKCYFFLDENYEVGEELEYIQGMINIFGLNETEKLFNVPQIINESDMDEYNESFFDVYETKYKLKGNLPIVFYIIGNIDTYIGHKSNNEKNIFYTKFNSLLEGNQNLTIEELIMLCGNEIGVRFDQAKIEKIKNQAQTRQVANKEDLITKKITEKMSSIDENTLPIGVVSSLIYNVIRKNLLNDGLVDNIDDILNEELRKKRDDGCLYYGALIIHNKNTILRIIKELYNENSELLNTNLVSLLRGEKEIIGDRWLKKIRMLKNGIKPFEFINENEKNILFHRGEKSKIELHFDKRFELKKGVAPEKAYGILKALNYWGILTDENIFSVSKPYSKNFGKWFLANKEEMMRYEDLKMCSYLHGRFEWILKNPNMRAMFYNNRLSIDMVWNYLDNKKITCEPGHEEFARIATDLEITGDIISASESIFKITEKREKSYISQEKSTNGRYRGRILRADDPFNIFAGNATDCCQQMFGVGEGSMRHGATADNGRIFVVEELDENDKVVKLVAQSWVWRNKDRVCFDNIEIPVAEHETLKNGTTETMILAQQKILQIYIDCAKKLLKQDENMLKMLFSKGKITQRQFDEIVLKDVVVGTGYNDLGSLKSSNLEVVPESDMIYPKEKRYTGIDGGKIRIWIDSGINSTRGEGAQLYLAKSGRIRQQLPEKTESKLEDLPLLYVNNREVRELIAQMIDDGVVAAIKRIEDLAYRDEQKMLTYCETYEDIANILNMDENRIQVNISREKDWYMIFEERNEEFYIADVAMVNGINSQRTRRKKYRSNNANFRNV